MRVSVTSERGDIVVGWLSRVALVFAVVGVVGYDAISIGVTRASVSDRASSAAMAGSEAWAHTGDARQVTAAVTAAAAQNGDTVRPNSIRIDQDGTVHTVLCHTATTLLAYRTKTTRKWTVQCGAGQGRTVES